MEKNSWTNTKQRASFRAFQRNQNIIPFVKVSLPFEFTTATQPAKILTGVNFSTAVYP